MASRAERNAISGRLGFNWGVIWGKSGSHFIGRWLIGDAKSVVIL